MIDEHEPDILILAECAIPLAKLLEVINEKSPFTYTVQAPNFSRLVLLSRLPANAVQSVSDEGGIAIRRLFPPLGDDLLLIALHLSSKLYLDKEDQAELTTRLRQSIEDAEEKIGHCRTIVIGDLNMDPFERGLVSSEALHAVMDRTIAAKGSRIVKGRDRRFFYNPMWSRLGDATNGPAGTYYRAPIGLATFYWHTFDQILIRPDLLPRFKDDQINVLTSAGSTALITSTGVPNKKDISDHLPLLLTI